MARISKRKKALEGLVDRTKSYGLKEAISMLKGVPKLKFDETVEIAVKLNINPKQTSQAIRGTIVLPHGTGKKVRIVAFCKGEAEKSAKEAGADFVGAEDLVTKIQGGWCEFDVAVATPDMMKDIAKLGRILGPRGLMPNPKAGTVTTDMTKAINEVKAGKIEYKMDKQGGIHAPVGKVSFTDEALCENSLALIDAIMGSNPTGQRGQHVRSLFISSTMGPGVRLNLTDFR